MEELPGRWDRIKRIFESAMDLAPTHRDQFLSEACAGDDALRREVESLLAAHEEAGDFIESPPAEAMQLAAELKPVLPYKNLGPYRLIELISSGGMGSVYRAERDDDEFRRRVAVKVIGRGMNTEFILHPASLCFSMEGLRLMGSPTL
jgi:hypothetical protein